MKSGYFDLVIRVLNELCTLLLPQLFMRVCTVDFHYSTRLIASLNSLCLHIFIAFNNIWRPVKLLFEVVPSLQLSTCVKTVFRDFKVHLSIEVTTSTTLNQVDTSILYFVQLSIFDWIIKNKQWNSTVFRPWIDSQKSNKFTDLSSLSSQGPFTRGDYRN